MIFEYFQSLFKRRSKVLKGSSYLVMIFGNYQDLFKQLSKVLIMIKLFRNDFRILSRPFQTGLQSIDNYQIIYY